MPLPDTQLLKPVAFINNLQRQFETDIFNHCFLLFKFKPTQPPQTKYMECKNCEKVLSENVNFCDNCGAQVVKERIEFKKLFRDIWDSAFGLDNKYFVTLKLLIFRPQIVLSSYLSGTRKKYVRPFAFFAVAATISLLTFNQFSDDYLKIAGFFGENTNQIIDEKISQELEANLQLDSLQQSQIHQEKLVTKAQNSAYQQKEMQINVQRFILKYFNIISFLFLPFYTLLAFFVYRKPYNFGEHLIINAYLQGISFFITLIGFIISIFTSPDVYMSTLLITMAYYTFAYGKLLELSFKQAILKFLKFLLLLVFFMIGLIILGVLLGVLIGFAKSFFGQLN